MARVPVNKRYRSASDLTPSERVRFAAELEKGTHHKVIARMFGIGDVTACRRTLGLPGRYKSRDDATDIHTNINLGIRKSLLDQAQIRAHARGLSMSAYIRSLIRRDIGASL